MAVRQSLVSGFVTLKDEGGEAQKIKILNGSKTSALDAISLIRGLCFRIRHIFRFCSWVQCSFIFDFFFYNKICAQ